MIYPAAYNFTIEQRASFDRSFSLSDGAGEPLDLTGFDLTASLWTPSRRKLLDFTLTWVDQSAGQFTLTLTPAQTTNLSGAAVWDLYVLNPDTTTDYYLRGEVLIEKGYSI